MKKKYIIISIFAFVLLLICICVSIEQKIYPTETTIETPKTDSIYIDTLPIINNSITPYINQDSLDRVELIRDSIQFRKITKKINGGYNGFADRYVIWLRARNVLKNKQNEKFN